LNFKELFLLLQSTIELGEKKAKHRDFNESVDSIIWSSGHFDILLQLFNPGKNRRGSFKNGLP
jgi:hypothetical protein